MRAAMIALCVCMAAGLACDAEAAEKPLRVALLTGGHGFEEKPFLDIFKAMPGMTVKHVVLPKDQGYLDAKDAAKYDVVVFYNMSSTISEAHRQSFKDTLARGAGMVLLHHAIANYPDWPEYATILGAKYFLEAQQWEGAAREKSEYTHDVQMPVHVEDPEHPITKGVQDFTIHDEVYRKWMLYPGSQLLLSCSDPLSDKAVGWTRPQPAGKLCFLQLGHGPEAYANPNFQTLVERAIRWAAPENKAK